MYRFLASRRWLVRTLAGLLLVAVCFRLGLWQLDRNEERTSNNGIIETNVAADSVAVDELTTPGESLDADDQWRTVRITGSYDPEHEVSLRLRPVGGVHGVHAITPLVTEGGDAVLVDRGFVETENRTDDQVDLPPPPSGTVTVEARVRESEVGNGTGADSSGQTIRHVDVEAIADTMPYPLYGAWAERIDQDPAPAEDLRAIPPPQTESGPHLSYAVQWFIFAVIGVGGFVLLIRAEARGRREAAEPAAPETGDDTAEPQASTPAHRE